MQLQNYQQTFVNFIAFIRSNYSPALPVFLACGPMATSTTCSYVQNVVKTEISGQRPTYYIDMMNIETGPGFIGCNGHPNTRAHAKMAERAIPVLQKVLGWK